MQNWVKNSNQTKNNYANKRFLVGVSKTLMDRLQMCGFDQHQLSMEELLELRFKNWHTCYIEGIPLNKFNVEDVAKKFGVNASAIRFKPLPKNSDRFDVVFGCCYIEYNDEKRCKTIVNKINANKLMYDNGWKIRANYGLLRYCKYWVYGRCKSLFTHGNNLHGIYCNFNWEQIHTKDIEKNLKDLPCGPATGFNNYKQIEDYKVQTEIDISTKMNVYHNNLYDLCEQKFMYWLCDVVRLKQYILIFKKNEWNDISMVEYIDEDVITNELGITNKIHIKLLLRRIEEFKNMRQEFDLFLNTNVTMKHFKQNLIKNGILTINDLKQDVKTDEDVKRIFTINDKQKLQQILNIIHAEI